MKANISAAQKGRREKILSTKIRLSTGEIVTSREFIDRLRKAGGTLKTWTERRYDKEDSVRDEIARRFRSVPFGNPNHPETIQFEKDKARLEASLTISRTGIQLPDGTFFELNKTELDYLQEAIDACREENAE